MKDLSLMTLLIWLNREFPTREGKNHCVVVERDKILPVIHFWIDDEPHQCELDDDDLEDVEAVKKSITDYAALIKK